jgi:hypothetical protein
MIELIQTILEKNKDRQLNLSSATCRQTLAREIAKELEKYFYNPQTLGIVVGKAAVESSYPCWYVWGPDWQANADYAYLAVLEYQLEKIN